MTVTLEGFFAETNPVVDPLWTDLANIIRQKADANPRHLQRELGPSEVGHPCMRKVAYGLMEAPRCNPEWDPLPSIYGVAMHTWLEGAARYDNEKLGRKRWIIETKVEVATGLSGTADLYDCDSGTVIDWKNLGYTSFPKYVKDPGLTYSNQVQLYGKGFARLGYPVRKVAIALLPRTGTLSKMKLHIVDYDEKIADAVLARRQVTIALIDDLRVEVDPDRYHLIPAQPDNCIFCPQWSPKPTNGFQCKGDA